MFRRMPVSLSMTPVAMFVAFAVTAAGAEAPPTAAAPAADTATEDHTAAAPAASPTDTKQCSDVELSTDVPALYDFHEVIMPLWHDAWPNKDFELMRKLMPQIDDHVVKLQQAELPGILRDKRDKWDAGVADVAVQAAALQTALKADQPQPALDAAEALHAGFEGLVRVVRPRMKELEAYHQVLYRVYHYDWPNRDLTALAGHAAELATACAPLAAATVPKQFAAKEAQLREGFAALCTATGELAKACGGKDEKLVGTVVEKVHTSYQACEKMFD
jgi:hypothetical protein